MANEKAIGNLVIHMGLDDKQMRPTLKNIEQSIKAVDSAWKATYQSQKRVGDDLGAAKTKYDGLNEKLEKQKLLLAQQQDILKQTGTRTKENAFDYDRMTTAIGKSQAKVERFTAQLKAQQRTYDLFKTGIPDLNKKLKQQQETTEASSRALEDQGKHTKALMSTQNGYKDQMSTLNDLIGRQVKLFHSMSKSDDSDAYHNQAVRIQNLKHQLSGLQDSYENVGKEISKEQYQQRNSGHTIDDLNKKLNQQKETTNAYVETLAKQGKSYDALVVKQRGLKEQTQIMTELVQKEQEKFSKMNKSLDGDDYHKQEMHVIQLKDKLRDLTGEFSRVSENVHKLDVNPFKRFSKGATEAKEKTKEAGFSTHKMMFANLASNAISSAWIAITGHIKEAIGVGKKYWIQQQKMQAVWTTLTGSAEKGKAMVNTINDFSVKTGQAVDVVDELQQGFYHLHSSKKEADMLTHAMLNMGDTVGLTGKQLNAVGQDMTHALAQGHLTTGALNQLAMYFPMVEEKLAQYEAKIHHKSHESSSAMVADLRAETKAGKVSAAAVEKLFDQLGNHKYAKAAENIMHTMFGMQRAIESRTPALIKDIEDPFMKVKSPIYAAIAKWVSDKRTDREFKKLGNSFALGATTISNAFAKAWHVNDFSKSADKGIDALSNSIERGSKKIAKNAPKITRFLKDLGGGSAKGLRIFAAATVDVSKVALPFLDIMAKYPKQSGLLVASLWAATKAQKAWHEAIQITDMAKTIAGWAAEKLSIKSNTGAIVLQNKELRENVKLKEEAAATSAGGVGGESGVGAGNTGKVAKEAREAEKVGGEAEKAGRFSKITSRFSNFKNVSKFGKVAAGGVGLFDVLNSATDLMGMTKKTAGSHVGAATGSLGGTAAGAAIGTAIFPGIGTAIGAGLGGMAGEGIGRKLGKAIQKGLTYKKIKTPKISMDSAYNKLLSQGKSYYSKKKKQDLADVKLLYKNGDLTKAQYEKRVNQIKKSGAKANTLTKASEKGQNTIIKAYTQARQKLSESYNRKILNAQIKYGTRSKQAQELENKKKKALAKQQYDYEHNITVKQAKLQTTLNGKLKLSADKQKKIYEDLVHSKKKLSENELKTTVSNAKKQEKETVKYANDTKSKAVKAAYKKYAQTVNAAKNEYKGHSKWSDEQRKKVIDHATDERDKSIAAAEKKRKDTTNKAHDQYKKTVSYAHSQNKGVTSETSSEYTSTKKINSQIKGNYDLTWGDIWGKVGKWANKMISGLNKGPIKGQNSVFSQYGGTNTLSAINTSYFATGTGLFSNQRRPISKPTLAILNDGHDSPETGNKEALIHPNGMAELVQGTNTPRLLGAGTEVLNATETKLASELGLVHFAGGTGVFSNIFGAVGKFFKKAVGSLKQKLSAITGFMNHSDKTFDSTFNPDLGKAKGAVFNGYKHLANHKIKNQGQKWWGAAWNVINGVANSGGGDATGLLAAVEKYGKGNKYVWGAAGPDSFDCSGLVMYALKHAFGINYPHFSGAQYSKSEHINKSSAKPGDLVFWGPSSHVGVYAGGSKYYSAFSPSAHPNIGMYNMYTHGGDGKMLFGRVAGLSDKSGSKKHGKQPKGLMGFAEKQLKKSGVLAWVKKFLEPLTDAGNPSGDGVGRWRSLVVKALKANGFSASDSQVKAWLQVIQRESGGNPNARQPGKDPDHDGSGPALGLVQTKRGTFNAYKKSGHGNIFNGFDDLLAGINYAKHRYGRGASMFNRVAAEGYSNGGLTTMSKLIHISEQNKPEMILPLTDRNRSVQLINQAKNMMNLPKTENLTNIALIKLVNNLSKTVDKLSEKLDNINDSIINKPIISDNMVGKMYDNYSARKTFKKRAIRGDNPL